MVAAFLLTGLQLILGKAEIVGETFTNNDDLMRATQVRDLLNGQGWWDLHQYRLGKHMQYSDYSRAHSSLARFDSSEPVEP